MFARGARLLTIGRQPLVRKYASTSRPPVGVAASTAAASGAAAKPRKLTPAAKAKAQASASRALREQLQVTKATPLNAADVRFADAARIAQGPSSLKTTLKEAADGKEQIAVELDDDGAAAAAAVAGTEAAASATMTTPVRQIRDVYAFATAEAYDFDALVKSGRLPVGWQFIQDGEVIYIPQWPSRYFGPSKESPTTVQSLLPGVGEAFIFRSGSYVTWGINSDQSRKFARSILQGRPGQGGNAEIESYKEIGDEAMEYVMAEDQPTRVVGDVIVIGQKPRVEEELEGDYVDASANNGEPEDLDWSPLLARLAFSQGLCRSARLSVQEAALSAYLEEVADMPARLEAEGKVPLPRRQVIRKMGTLLKLRQRANLDVENFLDDPEMYWENGELEHHYDSICLALDIETRFKAYNEKLDHGENLLGVLRALLTEASTHRMELIIIYLIAMEVCMALISHEYLPSPTIVYDLASSLFGDAPAIEQGTASSASEVSNAIALQGSSVASADQSSYRQWIKSFFFF